MNEFYFLNDINFDNNYQNSIDFENISQQTSYFNSKKVSGYNTACQILKPQNSMVVVYVPFQNARKFNYCMYFDTIANKTYYAFINDVQYNTPETSNIFIEIDYFQSYMFDYEIRESFIEREHQDRFFQIDGTTLEPIYNIQPENLEIGNEYNLKSIELFKKDQIQKRIDNIKQPNEYENIMWVYITTKSPLFYDNWENVPTLNYDLTKINGIDCGVYKYFYPIIFNETDYQLSNVFKIKDDIKNVLLGIELEKINANDNVLNITFSRYAPFNFYVNSENNGIYNITMTNYGVTFPNYSVVRFNDENRYVYFLENQSNVVGMYRELKILSKKTYNIRNINSAALIDYEPKLDTFPYAYNDVNFFEKNIKILNEYIKNNTSIGFIKYCTFNNTDVVKISNYLIDYVGSDNLRTHYLTNSSELVLRTNAWQTYENQNKSSLKYGIAMGIGQSTLNLGLGIATGGIGLAVAGSQATNTIFGVANELIKRNDIKNTPDEIRGSNGDIIANYGTINNLFISLKQYEILPKFKEIIFKYFQKYGYACREFKLPNLRSRYYYNYIKMINCNISTNLNNSIKNKIIEIYQNGITLWHYRESNNNPNIFDYSKENMEMLIIGGY